MLKERQLNFTVVYRPAEEGGYTVMVPTLPGCITEGDTLDEAREMAKDAIQGYVDSLILDGEEVPVESGQIIEKVRISPQPA